MKHRKIFFVLITVLVVFAVGTNIYGKNLHNLENSYYVSGADSIDKQINVVLVKENTNQAPIAIYQILQYLKYNYYAPDSVDQTKLLNIALSSMQKKLQEKDIIINIPIISQDQTDNKALKEFNTFWDSHISQYENANHELEFVALDSMLKSFKDSHTGFIRPEALVRYQERFKNYGGIGIEIIKKDEKVFVQEVWPESPAEAAGILPFDQIIKADGQIITDLEDAVNYIRGLNGTPVVITVLRQGQQYDITVIRSNVSSPILIAKLIETQEKRILYVRLYTFRTDNDFVEMLSSAFKKYTPITGIIIDLRNNPGGKLENTYNLLEALLDKGIDLFKKKSRIEETMTTSIQKQIYSQPLAVLINQSSGSGSEVFSGVLQEQERAIIIGQKSMGHVSIGRIIRIPGYKAAVVVAVRQFFTAGGKKLEGVGVIPDIEVERTEDDIIEGRDPQLEKAIETLVSLIDNQKP